MEFKSVVFSEFLNSTIRANTCRCGNLIVPTRCYTCVTNTVINAPPLLILFLAGKNGRVNKTFHEADTRV